MSYRLLVKFKVVNSQVDNFAAMMQQAKSRIAEADGCRSVELLRSVEDPAVFVLSEVWESEAAHEDYAVKMRESGAMDKMATMLEQPPVAEFYEIQ